MTDSVAWLHVRPGWTVRLKDGYGWTVLSVQPAAGQQLSIQLRRPGVDAVTVTVPASLAATVLAAPRSPEPDQDERRALALLRDVFAAEVIECIEAGWCAGKADMPCTCTVNCGANGCVNFP